MICFQKKDSMDEQGERCEMGSFDLFSSIHSTRMYLFTKHSHHRVELIDLVCKDGGKTNIDDSQDMNET